MEAKLKFKPFRVVKWTGEPLKEKTYVMIEWRVYFPGGLKYENGTPVVDYINNHVLSRHTLRKYIELDGINFVDFAEEAMEKSILSALEAMEHFGYVVHRFFQNGGKYVGIAERADDGIYVDIYNIVDDNFGIGLEFVKRVKIEPHTADIEIHGIVSNTDDD